MPHGPSEPGHFYYKVSKASRFLLSVSADEFFCGRIRIILVLQVCVWETILRSHSFGRLSKHSAILNIDTYLLMWNCDLVYAFLISSKISPKV